MGQDQAHQGVPRAPRGQHPLDHRLVAHLIEREGAEGRNNHAAKRGHRVVGRLIKVHAHGARGNQLGPTTGISDNAAKKSVMPPTMSKMHWNKSAHITELSPPWIEYAPTPTRSQAARSRSAMGGNLVVNSIPQEAKQREIVS